MEQHKKMYSKTKIHAEMQFFYVQIRFGSFQFTRIQCLLFLDKFSGSVFSGVCVSIKSAIPVDPKFGYLSKQFEMIQLRQHIVNYVFCISLSKRAKGNKLDFVVVAIVACRRHRERPNEKSINKY